MKILMILNDPPYGTERSYNGVRLARNILKREPETELTMFLMGDAVACAKRGQKLPTGYYNMEVMLKSVLRGGSLLLCGTCMDARGITDEEVVERARRSTMDELASMTLEAERILIF
ncbi:MAG: DsrE family protein [Acidiferrobacterales bacterium]|nr:DsrE family protein [Acidiferrobacterales bacterium]